MKKALLAVMIVAAMLICFVGVGIAADSVLDEIKKKGVIVVSTDANYAPQSYLNDKGELEGFDISVAKEVAKRLGVKAKFVTPDWDMITVGKWGKRWDISIGSMTPTKERAKALHFSLPYYSAPAQFAVHKNNTTIKKVSDLAGKRIGVGTETTYDRFLNKNLEIMGEKIQYIDWNPGEIKVYPTDANSVEDLSLGDGARLDAIFSNRQTVAEAIRTGCGKGCPIKMVGEPLYYEPLVFALDKSRSGQESLLAELNKILRELHKDGTLVKLSEKFYHTDLIPKLD